MFAGGFSLAAMAAVCCGGDQAAAVDLVDQLAAKSLVVAEPAAGGTRYRLLETIRQYAAGAWPRPARPGRPGGGTPRRSCAWPRRNAELEVLAREQDNFRAALDCALAGGGPAGPRLARRAGRLLAGPRPVLRSPGLAGARPGGGPGGPAAAR